MSITFTIDSPQSKRFALDYWFRSKGIKKKDFAKKMNVSTQRFSQILNGDYVSGAVFDQLQEIEIDGHRIPRDLIPVPSSPKKLGRKIKES
ncbi:helix-turn-helix transcriptional regulator [Maridesulfovibrio sp.]|uniref:helix-turn-helix transcriptional regulator n=1 Tax=Maridesulfovibrio sp. TaxID=2795000 RepID=UPI0029CA7981|nr:helix-turn-helix transcriptional regulator [Maridesulfovibrio sp.]